MEETQIIDEITGLLPRIAKGDIIASISENTSINFEMDQLKSIEDNSRFAIGLRLFEEGRVGNSYINSLRDTQELIDRAVQSAALGETIDFELPGPCHYPDPEHFHPEVMEYPKELIVKDLEPFVSRLKALHPHVQVSLDYSRGQTLQVLTNTSGFNGTYRETYSAFSASVILVEEGGGLLEIGDSDSDFTLDVDREQVLSNIEWRFKHALKKSTLDTGYYPVLFAPDAVSLLLQPLTLSASSRTLYKGTSLFQGKEEQQICGTQFSLTDDPLLKEGVASYPFDDEGVVPHTLDIIREGVFKNHIFDLSYARRMDRQSTGHGGRSISGLPGPSYSNLVIDTGQADLESMIKDIDRGILVYDFLGEGMSNTLAGDVSVNIELGFLIEKGRVKGRVKDMMLSGNVFEWLRNIRALENRQHKNGSLYTPHILIDHISLAG